MPAVTDGTRIGAPIGGARQFIAIGLNYRKHAEEAGMAIPKDPVVFNKAITCISGPDDDVVFPEDSEKLDWEVELGFVIGVAAQRVSRANALSHIAGYCLANDVSERDWQANRGGQWGKGKSFDTFGPLGPWLVTADEIPNPQAIPLSLAVNGAVRQKSNTSDMIFPVAELVSHLSQFMTLAAGRRRHHRHAPGRRPRHEAAAVPQARRRRRTRRRHSRLTAATGRLKTEHDEASPTTAKLRSRT